MTLVRRSAGAPASVTTYGEYREWLRYDFWYSCAYCTMTELEAASIGFQIDHYEPQAAKLPLPDRYDNLMWSCEHCNRAKTDHPSEKARAQGFRFFKADVDDAKKHFELSGNSVAGKTKEVGDYSITTLRLNSLPKRELRRKREELQYSRDAMMMGVRALAGIATEQLPKEVRMRFESAKADVQALSRAAGELRSELLRTLFSSPLREPDTDARQTENVRRKYLRDIERAFVPAPAAEPVAAESPQATSPKKSRKRR